MDAKRAIWIVADARAEHIKAVTWLNETGSASTSYGWIGAGAGMSGLTYNYSIAYG
jgi:hypothetical protein